MVVLLVLLFDEFEMLDVFGPLEMFGMTNKFLGTVAQGYDVVTVAEKNTVKAHYGPTISCDFRCADFTNSNDTSTVPKPGILFIPGGLGARREKDNIELLNWIRMIAKLPSMQLICTVCTGSLILAQTGLLDGKKATTNKLAFDEVAKQRPSVEWIRQARWCFDFGEDGKFATSSGVAAGIDMSLALIAEQHGRQMALDVAKRSEYIWNSDSENDPFASRSSCS